MGVGRVTTGRASINPIGANAHGRESRADGAAASVKGGGGGVFFLPVNLAVRIKVIR